MSDATTNTNQRLLNRTGAAVAGMLVVILGAGIYLLATKDIPEKNHDILLVLITAVAANVGIVISYFFGSSSGAKAKDDTINTLTSTAATIASQALPKADVTLPPGASVKVAADTTQTEPQP